MDTHQVRQFTLCVPASDASTIKDKSNSSFSISNKGFCNILPVDDIIILYASDLESTKYPVFDDNIVERSVDRVEFIFVPKHECMTIVLRALSDSTTMVFSSGIIPSLRFSIILLDITGKTTCVLVLKIPTFLAVE